jgi:hypothetical protein
MLPKISTPIYTISLPSDNKTIKIRPYTVKEEKLLLTAAETQNAEFIMDTVKNVIQNCLDVNKDKVSIEKLPNIDLEYVFLQLRIKSVGETTMLGIKVPVTECSEEGCPTVPVEIDLTTVDIIKDDTFTNKIMIDDNVGVVMRYPTIEILNKIKGSENIEAMYEVVAYSIENVFDQETVYNDFTEKEIMDFITSLDTKKFAKILEFFQKLTKLQKTVTYNCPKCKMEKSITLEGFMDFFI